MGSGFKVCRALHLLIETHSGAAHSLRVCVRCTNIIYFYTPNQKAHTSCLSTHGPCRRIHSSIHFSVPPTTTTTIPPHPPALQECAAASQKKVLFKRTVSLQCSGTVDKKILTTLFKDSNYYTALQWHRN